MSGARRLVFVSVATLVAVSALIPSVSARGTRGAPPAVTGDPVIAAAGDIACRHLPGTRRRSCRYDDVSELVAAGSYDAFLPLGDVQYEYGRYHAFLGNYDVYFGRVFGISRPIPGNHEYGVSGAAGYFKYFGSIAYGPGGYYSFDIGSWHVIALNSAVCPAGKGCGPGNAQYEWLADDLAAHPSSTYPCTLAYFHHRRFDWMIDPNASWTDDPELLRAKPFWNLLVAGGADVVLAGHKHNYSRWLPMDKAGDPDPNGIVQFVVGTGGRSLMSFGDASAKPPTFATGTDDSFGILELTLHAGSYDYRFLSAGPKSFTDADSGVACH